MGGEGNSNTTDLVLPEVEEIVVTTKETHFHLTSDLNPYIIISSGTPGLLLAYIRLREENYEEWATTFRNGLNAKRELCFIVGFLGPYVNSKEWADWSTMNSFIVVWIFNTIDQALSFTISYMEDAKDLWNEFEEYIFTGKDHTSKN